MRQSPSVVLFLLLASATAARALPQGHLDPQFAAGGGLFLVRPLASTAFADFGIQPDGRLVVRSLGVRREGPAIVRVEADGSGDPNFGQFGQAPLPSQPGTQLGRMVVRGDGKIVLGTSTAPSTTIQIARYLANGLPDPGFGTAGLSAPLAVDVDAHLIPLPDGRLVIVGTTVGRIVRLLDDGTPDASLDGDGVLDLPEPPFGAVVQSDGRFVIAFAPAPAFHAEIVRYGAGGATDPGWGTGGVTVLPTAATALDLLPDDRVVVAIGGATPADGALYRLLAGGQLDPSFQNAIVVPRVSALAHQADGRTLFTAVGATPAVAVARRQDDGSPDTGFGIQGVARATPRDGATALAVRPDGRIVTLGGGAVLAQWFGGTCGNGTLEPGEDCDDGNLVGGDGCDAGCCTADADGDGVCDTVDPCTAPIPATRGSFNVGVNATTQGAPHDTTRLNAEAVLPPFSPALDPRGHGVRLRVTDAAGERYDVMLPPGMYDRVTHVGWKVAGGTNPKWTFVDNTPPAFGATPRVPMGKMVTVRATPATGRIQVRLRSRDTGLAEQPPGTPVVSIEILLNGATDVDGTCMTLAFPGPPPAPACAFRSGTRTVLDCR